MKKQKIDQIMESKLVALERKYDDKKNFWTLMNNA